MEGEYGGVQEGSADDGKTRRQPKNRSPCPDTRGRWAIYPSRGSACSRPQCVSSRTTGDAAEEHRDLSARIKLRSKFKTEEACFSLQLSFYSFSRPEKG